MHRIDPPGIQASVVFSACISNVTNADLKRRLTAILGDIEKCAARYCNAAAKAELYKIVEHKVVGEVTCDEMTVVYDRHMAREGAPGRVYYDKIRSSAPCGRCPLCGQPKVSTLDHHLPKARFPSLAVTPVNLVPACRDCNTAKLKRLAASSDEQTFHPYFDDVESCTWLCARVVEGAPAAATFFVDVSALPSHLAKRAKSHFRAFQLDTRFAMLAASELTGMRYRIVQLLRFGGATAVRLDLSSLASSWGSDRRNCWQAALYTALASSEWYCEGGCEEE